MYFQATSHPPPRRATELPGTDSQVANGPPRRGAREVLQKFGGRTLLSPVNQK